jgi:acetylornithine deacetylase/succinyl-diaminopimelate desuccinylase-like protein
MNMSVNTGTVDIDAEVVSITQDLIRIDSTNFGDDSGPGEAAVAEYVEASLKEFGIDCERFTTTSGKRQGVFARIEGSDPSAPALLVHGHLDVVPAVGKWQHDPFSAEIHDGMVWGRGAVDMKDGNGILLSTVRAWKKSGVKPRRSINLLFLPDEEAGGKHGAHWLVDNRNYMFEGVSEAVGEVGGFSLEVNKDLRLYFIETAEKGIRWMQLTAKGQAGHGSMLNKNNAVTELAETLTRIGRFDWPVRLTKTNEALVRELSEAFKIDLDPTDVPSIIKVLGPMARLIGATFQNSAQPTMLDAGYKVNVIPELATAQVDGRVLPGFEQEFDKQIDELLGPNVTRIDTIRDIAMETPFDGPTVDAMAAALRQEDPKSHAVPYVLSGGTDGKAFARLGIRCYGFIPLQLPPTLDFAALFHGVDERVPVDALRFGVRVMDRFLKNT